MTLPNAVALVAQYTVDAKSLERLNTFIVSKNFPREPGNSYKVRLRCEFNESDCYSFKNDNDTNVIDIYVKLGQGYQPIGKYKTETKFIHKSESGDFCGKLVLSDEDEPYLEFKDREEAFTWLLSE